MRFGNLVAASSAMLKDDRVAGCEPNYVPRPKCQALWQGSRPTRQEYPHTLS